MRPVLRGKSPQVGDFDPYTGAKPSLISRLGMYCSYCERKIVTQLAVEHIIPKNGPHGDPRLKGRWDNFLLGCVNCNSTKSDKKVDLGKVFLPDRDNTFTVFTYSADGKIKISAGLKKKTTDMARAILSITGLDKAMSVTTDENDRLIALDRVSQRMETWGMAEDVKQEIRQNPGNMLVVDSGIRLALASGFFSIWMTVFANDQLMRNRLIDAFPGTRASKCFDARGQPVSPAPNPDELPYGGKA